MIHVPDQIIPVWLRLTRANAPYRTAAGAERRLQEAALRPRPYGPPRRLRPDVQVDAVQDGHWPVYTVTPRLPTTGGEPGSPGAGGVVYVHGGGWVNEIVVQHWTLVAAIAAEARVTVTVPIYPLLPHGDAKTVRDGLVELVRRSQQVHGPTSLAGDSAGGQIALSAALRLRDEGVVLPLTTLISPALDLTWSNPLIPRVQPSDPWLGRDGGLVLAEAWRGELDLTDPAVSPLFGDLTGLGPLSVFSGTRDILNPDAHLLVQKARASGVAVELHEQPGQLHVYPLLPTRSGHDARRIIIGDLRTALRHHG